MYSLEALSPVRPPPLSNPPATSVEGSWYRHSKVCKRVGCVGVHDLLHVPMLGDAGSIEPKYVDDSLVKSTRLLTVNVESNVIQIRDSAGHVVDKVRCGQNLFQACGGNVFTGRSTWIVLDVRLHGVGEESIDVLIGICLRPYCSRLAL